MNNAIKGDTSPWKCRGYLPHFEQDGLTTTVTFRLAGSLPNSKLIEWSEELCAMPDDEKFKEYRRKIEEYLNRGMGPTWLSDERCAEIVQNALLFFHRQRYELQAWVVMPNHVHVLFSPTQGYTVSAIVQVWKSFSARKINDVLQRSGTVWQPEYFDRYMRSERHYQQEILYIENNPVSAGLCSDPSEWRFGSAYHRKVEWQARTPALRVE